MKEVKLGECGLSYAVVSIMGPQSSGMFYILRYLKHIYIIIDEEVMNSIPSEAIFTIVLCCLNRQEYTLKFFV